MISQGPYYAKKTKLHSQMEAKILDELTHPDSVLPNVLRKSVDQYISSMEILSEKQMTFHSDQ